MITTPIQIRFADIDMLRHVNNVNLQHYFDQGKTDYFREVMHMTADWEKEGLIQKATNTAYEAQTRLYEPIVVTTKVEKIGNKSITMYQEIINPETGEVKAYSTSTLVCFHFSEQHSIPVPEAWRTAIIAYEKI